MPDDKTTPPEDLTGIPTFVENLLGAPIERDQAAIDLAQTAQRAKVDDIRRMEEALFLRGIEAIDGVSRFGQVDPATNEPSREMIEQFGHDPVKLAEMNRLARYGLMSAKEAPVGIAVMKSLVVGLARARSLENMAPRSLNVAVVYQGAPPELNLPEQILEDE